MIPAESLAFAEILRSCRMGAGLSQEQLAERARLSARGISDLERGARRTPRLQTVRMLADALGLGKETRAVFFEAARRPGAAIEAPINEPDPDRFRVPIAPTRLIGREQELAIVIDLLQRGPRLVTITGAGGVGKTRLALEAMPKVAPAFPDGAQLIDLAPLTDPSRLPAFIAHALGLRLTGNMSPEWEVATYVRDKRLLLALDNVEHVVSGTAFLADVLAASPRLVILTTSRIPLQLRGERQVDVRPLRVPDAGDTGSLSDLARIESVQLFVERARDIMPGFALSSVNAAAISTICRRLDGLPLALELAAARVTILPPNALVNRINRCLPLLAGGSHDAPPRHRTLRDAIAWSYDLLGPAEQALFRRLAIFDGGWTLQAASRVVACDDRSDIDVLEGVETLIRASLVQAAAGQDGVPRFTMLETVREFARERLESGNEAYATSRRLADYVGTLARAAIGSGNEQPNVTALTAEQGNIRAALGWLRDQGYVHEGLRLAISLGPFWRLRSLHEEGQSWLESFLSAVPASDVPVPQREAALRWAGELAALHGDPAAATRHLTECLSIARGANDPPGLASCLGAMGAAMVHRGDVAAGIPHLAEGIGIARELGDRRDMALRIAYLAFAIGHGGDGEAAVTLADEAESVLHLLRDTGSYELAFVDLVKGWLGIMTGTNDLATSRLESAVAMSRSLDAKMISAAASAGMGELALRQGRIDAATIWFREGLVAGSGGTYPAGAALNLQGLVRIAVHHGQFARAARLAAAVEPFGGAMRILPDLLLHQYTYAAFIARSSLQDVPHATEHVHGREMCPEEIVARELAFPG